VTPPEAVPGGEQTIPFKQIGNIAFPEINLVKTVTTEEGTCPGVDLLTVDFGDTVKYCYAVTNPGDAPLYNVTLFDDNATAPACDPVEDPECDDFEVTLTGLTDEDGDGQSDDLAAGGTASGESGPVVCDTVGTRHNVGTASGDDSIIEPTRLEDTDPADVVVNNAVPTISTTPDPSSGTVGDPLYDTATLSDGSDPTGTITFALFDPSDATCEGTPVFTEDVSVRGNGDYMTLSGFASNAAGTWHWTASYSGDDNNEPASSVCADEQVMVGKADTETATAIHLGDNHTTDVQGTTVDLESNIHDQASVTGQVGETAITGTVDFLFFENLTCAGDGKLSGDDVDLVDGVAHPSTAQGPLAAGDYSFKAVYSGDDNYKGSTSPWGLSRSLLKIES
jgi:hypothetical protein